jgi:nucleoside-diphosphate-sugar epimerase
MSDSTTDVPPVVLVTGANGLVGARTCARLLERGAAVRALVRRPDTAPEGTEEVVGEVADVLKVNAVTVGVNAVVSTVHPMGSDAATQNEIGVAATRQLALAARDNAVERFVHVSTAAVYDRAPGTGDVDEHGDLVDDDGGDYPVAKRDADAAIAQVDGLTRVLVRPPAILGSGPSSVWNTRRPAGVRAGDPATAVPEETFAWVHADDLARLLADLAVGAVPDSTHPDSGPVRGGCTPVDVAGEAAVQRDYWTVVTDALGTEPQWADRPGWTGRYLTDRARRWGWEPRVSLADALAELDRDVRELGAS